MRVLAFVIVAWTCENIPSLLGNLGCYTGRYVRSVTKQRGEQHNFDKVTF